MASTSFADSAATSDLGPGTVSLNTGDFQIDATDASQGGLSVGRAATSLLPAGMSGGPTGIFGAGWRASLPGPDAGAGGYTLVDNSAKGYVTLTGSDGTSLIYQLVSGSGTSAKYVGIGDADDGSLLQCGTTCASWKLTDADGTVTTWTQTGSTWTVASIVQPGDSASTTTSFHYTTAGLPDLIVAPHDSGVTCSTSTVSGQNAGCQALSLTYAGSTTATGTGSSQWGDYINLVSGISYTAYNPATSAMVTVQVATYAYDSTGHLRAAWDPRVATPLKTRYAYDTRADRDDHPARASAWTMNYDTTGRLADGLAPTRPTAPPPRPSRTICRSPAPARRTCRHGDRHLGTDRRPGLHGRGGLPRFARAGVDEQPRRLRTDQHRLAVCGHHLHRRQRPSLTPPSTARVPGRSTPPGTTPTTTIWSLDSGRAHALNPTADTDPYVAAPRPRRAPTCSPPSVPTATTASTCSPPSDRPTPSSSPGTATSLWSSSQTRTSPTTKAHQPRARTIWSRPRSPVPTSDGTATTATDTKYDVTGYDPIDGTSATGDTSGWILQAPTVQTTIMGTGSGTRARTSDQDPLRLRRPDRRVPHAAAPRWHRRRDHAHHLLHGVRKRHLRAVSRTGRGWSATPAPGPRASGYHDPVDGAHLRPLRAARPRRDLRRSAEPRRTPMTRPTAQP